MTDFHKDTTAAIRQRLEANWLTTPILYENLDEEKIKVNGVLPDSFVVLETVFYDSEQRDIGDPVNRAYRSRGVIRLHILTPAGKGEGLSKEYADGLAQIFRGKRFDGVVCSAATIRGGGEKADAAGRYWRETLVVDFYADGIFNVT